jgi:hypothetical protein
MTTQLSIPGWLAWAGAVFFLACAALLAGAVWTAAPSLPLLGLATLLALAWAGTAGACASFAMTRAQRAPTPAPARRRAHLRVLRSIDEVA